ncbi:MAG: RsmB/NOP family class I SAM-dependent RNA methyltransferase [Bdellovibrionales bacterium]
MSKNDLVTRRIAFELLRSVVRQKQPFDEAMARHEDFAVLEKRDRAFVHALTAMALRRLGQIDDLIGRCLKEKQDLKNPVQDILRVGIAQLVFLGTPAHAAVDTAVNLAAQKNHTKPYKGLINAVLRRITREGEAMLAAQDEDKLCVVPWLWDAWSQTYGETITRAIARAHRNEALIDISVKGQPELWAKTLGGELLPTGSLRLKETVSVKELDGFKGGAWWVQDAAAALPVTVMGDVKGKLVYDLCAAPGGKAMQLASKGARVIAVDRSAKRLERVEENMARLGLAVEVQCCDALKLKPEERADIVLLDAPCSATGTLRRHPDVPYIKGPEDIARLCDLQEKLLDHAAEHIVKEGGMLVYAVCSLQAEEAEDQIERFLKRHNSFVRQPISREELSGLDECLTPTGDIRCLPCHWADKGGMDGFFVARMRCV